MSSQKANQTRVVIEGLAFGESPRWHEGRLWLCNWGTGEIVSVDDDGKSEVMLTVPAILPYSIDWLPDGRLLVISGREGLLLRQEADGTLVTHTDLRSLSNSPWNEIVVDGRGSICVNGGGPAPAWRGSTWSTPCRPVPGCEAPGRPRWHRCPPVVLDCRRRCS